MSVGWIGNSWGHSANLIGTRWRELHRHTPELALETELLVPSIVRMRGPSIDWERYGVADVEVTAPSAADRIEANVYIDSIGWNGSSCYLAYDMMECPDTYGYGGEYVSNFGRNFVISVSP